MKYKKVLSLALVVAMSSSLALSACGSSDENSAKFSDTTITGTVTEIDGETLTLSLETGNSGAGMQMPGDSGSQPGGTDSQPGGSDSTNSDSTGTNSSGTDSTSTDSTSTDSTNSDSTTPPSLPDNASGNGGSDNSGSGNAPGGSAPEQPSGGNNSGSSDNSTPPEKPDGDNSSQSGDNSSQAGGSDSSAPSGDNSSQASGSDSSAPSGDNSSQASGSDSSAPSGDSSATTDAGSDSDGITVELDINDTSVLQDQDGDSIKYSEIEVGDTLEVTFDDDGDITLIVWSEEGDASNATGSSDIAYSAVNEYTEDTEISNETLESTGTDENAALVKDGATVKLDGVTINRTSSDSTGGDNSSFYGVGAALLTTDGTTYLSNSTITTDSAGGAGVFSYGDGVTYVSNTTINTSQNTSGGIHVAGGGTLYAWDVTATTQGESAAAIRSDRGGGTMVIDGGTYTSNGTGSPAVYCTADITVNDSDLTANGSEAVCIEGLNTLRLYDCNLTGNMSDDSQNDCTWNVIVYQSMSGDSEVGNGTFSMTGGTLTAKNGGIFYTTNTDSTFYLSDVDITYADENDFFLRCTGNANQRGWGSTGANGANCTFTADDQDMVGDIVYDSISNLNMYMENGSTLTGAFVDDESCAGNGGSGEANLYVSSDSTWVVTADSTLTNLYSEGKIVDASGKTVSIVGTDGTVYVKGTSSLKVTVTSYSDNADLSGATSATTFADYKVENPF